MSKSSWRLLPPPFVARMLSAHSWLGLAVAAFIYVLCLSGTLLVFSQELARWEDPRGPVITEADTATIAAAMDTAYRIGQQHDALDFLMVETPASGTPRLFARALSPATGVDEIWLLDANAQPMFEYQAPFHHFLEHLHIFLLLPENWGEMVVGLMGVALLASIISGVLCHPRIFRDAFRLRLGGSKHLQEADLHNRLSVWGLPFHLAIAITGAVLGLATLILGALAFVLYDGDLAKAQAMISGPRLAQDSRPADPPPVARIVDELIAAAPDAPIQRVRIADIGTRGQMVEVAQTAPRDLAFTERYLFDGEGRQYATVGYATGPMGQQIVGALSPLHFGWFGGLPVKFAYLLLGAALTLVSANGVTIWIARRRDKGRPVPGWERAWTALLWSQPFAYAVTASAAILIPSISTLGVFLSACALPFLLAVLTDNVDRLRVWLRSLSAVAIAAVALMHTVRWAGEINDGMAWAVNLACLLCAALIAASIPYSRSATAANPSLRGAV